MTEKDAMRTAIMAIRHELFGDQRDADQLFQLFDSWESRANGFEAACGALLRMMANAGIDVESTLDNLALHLAGE